MVVDITWNARTMFRIIWNGIRFRLACILVRFQRVGAHTPILRRIADLNGCAQPGADAVPEQWTQNREISTECSADRVSDGVSSTEFGTKFWNGEIKIWGHRMAERKNQLI